MAELRVRKNWKNLTISERDFFLDSVLALKASGGYDPIVKLHADAMAHATPWEDDTTPSRRNAAHRGPAFLPWHRQYLQAFEAALQGVSGNSNLALPYWNWLEDGELTDPRTASIWSTEGLGGDGQLSAGWTVATGRFAEWPLTHNGGAAPNLLQRQMGVFTDTLPTKKAWREALKHEVYDTAPWDDGREHDTFRNRLEGWLVSSDGSRLHNQVHVWVGGSMLPGTSPNDPAFFLHHCFVDKLWADWQLRRRATEPDLAASYAPVEGGPPGHNLDDPMFPWTGNESVTPRSMLDHHALGFRYDTEITRRRDQPLLEMAPLAALHPVGLTARATLARPRPPTFDEFSD